MNRISRLELSFNQKNTTRMSSFRSIQNQKQSFKYQPNNQIFSQLQKKHKRYSTICHKDQIYEKSIRSLVNPQQLKNNTNQFKKIKRNLMYYIKKHQMTKIEAEQILKIQVNKQSISQQSLSLSTESCYFQRSSYPKKTLYQSKRQDISENINSQQKKPQRRIFNPNKNYYLKMKRIIHQNIQNRTSHKKLQILTRKCSQQIELYERKEQKKQTIKSERVKKYRDLSLKQLIYENQKEMECPLSPSIERKAEGMRLNFKNLVTLQPFLLETIDSDKNLTPYLKVQQINSDSNRKQKSQQKSGNPSIIQQKDFANFIKYKKRKSKFQPTRKISNKTQKMIEHLNQS